MERLTYEKSRNRWDEGSHPTKYTSRYTFQEVVARLAAYEDTGLEPEGVEQAKFALIGKSIAEIKEFNGVPLARMIELAQAEKDGRLVVLPPNDPLTLEELREMDEEPVWAVVAQQGTPKEIGWMLVDSEFEIAAGIYDELGFDSYGPGGWLVYRRKPEEETG